MKKLRNKFLVYILLPALLIILIGSLLSHMIAQGIVHKQLHKLATIALRRAADEVDVDLGRGIKVLQLLALHESIAPMSDEELRKLFVEMAHNQPYETVFMAFPDGRLISSSRKYETAQGDPRSEPWYDEAIKSSDIVLVPTRLSKVSGKLITSVVLKVTDKSGALKGVVGFHIPIEFIMSKTPQIEAVSEFKGAVFSILTRDGRYAIHGDKAKIGRKLTDFDDALQSKMWKALEQGKTAWHDAGRSDRIRGKMKGFFKRGSRSWRDWGGPEHCTWFAGYQKSRFADIYVAVEMPLPSATLPIHMLTAADLVLLIASLLVLSIILIRMAKKIAKPVGMLSEAAQRLSKGDYDQKLPVISEDELGDLTTAFNTMVDGLKQRDHIRDTFGRYLTEEVVNRLLESEDGLKLGGESREISILISDLRGFTPLTADMPPEKVIALLNRYLGNMVEIIMDHNGIVDEITGDGILAFFGAPEPMENHAAEAVACAIQMQSAMAGINSLNAADRLPALEMGIGINTGAVVVGNIGSEKRTKYGAVGAEINMTGRIESFTVGGQILISASTFELVRDVVDVKNVLNVEMKGFQGSVTLYEVGGMAGQEDIPTPGVQDLPAPVKERIPVRIHSLSDKVVTTLESEAWITHLSESSAVVTLRGDLAQLQDIRIDLPGAPAGEIIGEAFGKVISTRAAGDEQEAVVRFTFIRPEVRHLFREMLAKSRE
jgi:class 3 adenylate cyclase